MAARGDIKAAIGYFQAAQAAVPFPEYAAALDALQRHAGNIAEADRQRNLVDAIDRLGRANGEKGNRTLAVIFGDQGHKLDRALELAQGELEVRGDIYSYDALAWALYKNKRVPEAEKASDEALKFKTAEPTFYYHAGAIAAAAGKSDRARQYLNRALELNPEFDFRYAPEARRLLAKLSN